MKESVSFENTRALPRAWLVGEVRRLDQGDVLRAVHTSRLPDGSPFEPTQMALLEEPWNGLGGGASPAGARLAVRELAPGQVQIDTESTTATFCVLSDMFYPGWRATIDAAPARIIRTDYVLMGVELPPGRHTIEFRYVPTRIYLGAAVTGCSLLIVLALFAGSLFASKGRSK
jgi:hypothetical protein